MKTTLKTLAIGIMALALSGCGTALQDRNLNETPLAFATVNSAFEQPTDSPEFKKACESRKRITEKYGILTKIVRAGKVALTAIGTVVTLPIGLLEVAAGVKIADSVAVGLWKQTTDDKCAEAGL